jgi:cysteine desulfurase
MNSRIYLDNAATTPLDPEVLEAMMPFFKESYGNPSSIHTHGRKTKSAVENARKSIANALNTSPGEIFFTSGGTEADNMALINSVLDLGVNRIISSKIEHHAVLHSLDFLQKNHHTKIEYLTLDPKGNPDLDQLETLLTQDQKTLVSLMHANNEIGNMLDLRRVSEICKKSGALFHTDTVQTMGHVAIDLQAINVDFLVGSAHKFHGPKGVGFIYINAQNKISSLIHGGSQERNMRGGTENLYGIVGMAKALEVAVANLEKDRNHIADLKNKMLEGLLHAIPGLTVNGNEGDTNHSLHKVLNVSFPPHPDNEMLLFKLDIEGISCSGGSACSSGTNLGSHVLQALHIDDDRANVRFSFSKFNTNEEIEHTLEVIKNCFI